MLLSLDLGYTTAWALWAAHLPKPLWGTETFNTEADKNKIVALCDVLPKFYSWLTAMVAENRVTSIAIETVYIGKGGHQDTRQIEIALAWRNMVYLVAGQRAIKPRDVNINDWRKYFIGRTVTPHGTPAHKKHDWFKQAAADRCAALGWFVSNPSYAEALGLLDYVRATTDPKRGTETAPLFSPLF